jgi:hypothetical protein
MHPASEPSARDETPATPGSAIGETERTFAPPPGGGGAAPDVEAAREGLTAMIEAAFEPFTRALSLALASGAGGEPSSAPAGAEPSEAGEPLDWIGQETARAWLALAKQGICANLAALSDPSRCRSAADLMEWHTWVVREQLRIISEAGDVVVEATTKAFEQASQVLQRSPGGPPLAE